MDAIQSMEQQIRELEQKIQPLEHQLRALQMALRTAKSQEWIRVNGVTKEDVQFSRGDGIPYFGHIAHFGDWIATQPTTKPWCEWNGCIHRTSDVIAQRWEVTPGNIEDLDNGR